MALRIASTAGWAAVEIEKLRAENALLRKANREVARENAALQRQIIIWEASATKLRKVRLVPRGGVSAGPVHSAAAASDSDSRDASRG